MRSQPRRAGVMNRSIVVADGGHGSGVGNEVVPDLASFAALAPALSSSPGASAPSEAAVAAWKRLCVGGQRVACCARRLA